VYVLDFAGNELVQLKLNIMRFYEVKYALDFGGGLYPHRSKNKEPTLIEVGVMEF
jgi:hypothetical protein